MQAEGPKGETLVETDMEGPGSSFGPSLWMSPACESVVDDEEAVGAGCIVKGGSLLRGNHKGEGSSPTACTTQCRMKDAFFLLLMHGNAERLLRGMG
jgi:hypothetical protein